MATVDRKFADNIIAGKGWYNGDSDNSLGDNPRCIEITEYTTPEGNKAYGLTMSGRINAYTPSPFVNNPTQFWKAD